MAPTKAALYYANCRNKLNMFIAKPDYLKFYWDRFRKYSSLASFESFIVSYPKSGRTWLQRMIIESMNSHHNKSYDLSDVSIISEHFEGFPHMLSTHAGSSWEELVKNESEILENDFKNYQHAKTIFLYRDPRDVLVSQYYHIVHRTGFKSLTKHDTIFSKNIGLKKVINFMNKWKGLSNEYPKNIMALAYEDLRAEPVKHMTEIFKFIEHSVSSDAILDAINKTSLKKMQEKEAKGKDDSPWTKTSSSNANAFHSRKGMVGEYKEFFQEDQIRAIDEIIQNELHSDFSLYLK